MISCVLGLVVGIVALILAAVSMGKINKVRKTLSGDARDDLDHAYNASTGLLVLSLLLLVGSGLCLMKKKGTHALGRYFD